MGIIRARADEDRARPPGRTAFPAELVTAMFMGDRSEHLFKLGGLRLRGYGTDVRASGDGFLELPADDLWVFATPA